MAGMLCRVFAVSLLASLMAMGAEAPLPGLKVEAIDAGSVLRVSNPSSQPLSAFLIELVGYPGSYYALWRDDPSSPIAPGAELRIQIVNMTVGAAPEYVKMQAAIYSDGSLAGIPEKAAQIVERRRFVLQTTRELIQRLETAAKAGAARDAIIAGLKQWSESLPPAGRPRRNTQPAINQTAGRELIADACKKLEVDPPEKVIASLRVSENVLASAKPVL